MRAVRGNLTLAVVSFALMSAAAHVRVMHAQVAAPPMFEAIRRTIVQRMAADSVPALGVAVIKDGRVIWEEAFGVRDRATRAPVGVTTPFAIGSVSKPLTATALMVLVERGRIRLGDPINAHLNAPGVRNHFGDARAITVQQVATHTSGIARHDLFDYIDEARPPLTIDELMRRYAEVVRRPGVSYEYTNLGYMLLADVVARRAGTTFAEAMQRLVFAPLAMTHSVIGTPRDGDVVLSYDDRRQPVPLREESQAGAGGAFSTAGDLARFGAMHVGAPVVSTRAVLNDTSRATMHRPRVQTDSGAWYAIGWRVDRAAFGVETIYHTGSNGASASIVAFVPGEGLTVAVIANCVTNLPGVVARDVIAAFGPRVPIAVHPEGYPTARIGQQPYRVSSTWRGAWAGSIDAPDGTVAVSMRMDSAGAIFARIGDAPEQRASGVRIEDGFLRGSLNGEIPNHDTRARRYRLHFKLARVAERLVGSVTAASIAGERVITLSSWTALARTP